VWPGAGFREHSRSRAQPWIFSAITAVLITLGCRSSPPAPSPSNPVCGVERWPVKTLTDADAMQVDVSNVIPTTITALNRLATRCSGLPNGRTFAEEFRVYEVVGIVQLTRNEEDRESTLHWPIQLTQRRRSSWRWSIRLARPRRRCSPRCQMRSCSIRRLVHWLAGGRVYVASDSTMSPTGRRGALRVVSSCIRS
jgi:hypothetical protein